MYDETGEGENSNERKVLTERYHSLVDQTFGGKYNVGKPDGQKYATVEFVPFVTSETSPDELREKVVGILDARLRLLQEELKEEKKKGGMALDAEKNVWHAEQAIKQMKGDQKGTDHLDEAVAEISEIQDGKTGRDFRDNEIAVYDATYPMSANRSFDAKYHQVQHDWESDREQRSYLTESNLKGAHDAAMANLKTVRERVMGLVKAAN